MEQLERSQRYLLRLRAVYAGVNSEIRSKQECEDDLLSFFMHCYHIRDWIIHLNMVSITAKQVDQFIDANECLKICADLCNGAKHCVLTRSARTGGQPHFSGRQYKSSIWYSGSGGCEITQAKYSIVTSSGALDALALAEECMQCWSDFVARMRLVAAETGATSKQSLEPTSAAQLR
jgi:hypothetical protein